jgi:hypothetical protein
VTPDPTPVPAPVPSPKPEPSFEWVQRFWRLSARAVVDAITSVLDAVSAALKDDESKSEPPKTDTKSA